jgi:hypothetical protein
MISWELPRRGGSERVGIDHVPLVVGLIAARVGVFADSWRLRRTGDKD